MNQTRPLLAARWPAARWPAARWPAARWPAAAARAWFSGAAVPAPARPRDAAAQAAAAEAAPPPRVPPRAPPAVPPPPPGTKPLRAQKHALRRAYGLPPALEPRGPAGAAGPDAGPGAVSDAVPDAVPYLAEIKEHIRQIVQLLDDITDISAARVPAPAVVYPSHFARRHRPAASLPRYPPKWTPASLEAYLAELTESWFVDDARRLSDAVGLVSQIVTDLLRPNNPWTRAALTPRAYTLGVRYFLGAGDVEAARWLEAQMRAARLAPELDLHHLFLWSLAKAVRQSPYPSAARGHPLSRVAAVLRRLRRERLGATSETWNLVLQAMPMGFGKSFLVEEMGLRDIPLNDRSQCVCVALISDKLGLEPALEYALGLGRRGALAASTLATAADALLRARAPDNANVLRAFQLVDYALRHLGVPPTAGLLNTLLHGLAIQRRPAWQLGVLAYFGSQWNVAPTSASFQHLLRGAWLARRTPAGRALLPLVVARAHRLTLTPEARCTLRQIARAHGGELPPPPPRDAWAARLRELDWAVATAGGHLPEANALAPAEPAPSQPGAGAPAAGPPAAPETLLLRLLPPPPMGAAAAAAPSSPAVAAAAARPHQDLISQLRRLELI